MSISRIKSAAGQISSSKAKHLVLYGTDISPPCRFVLMTLKALNLHAELQEVDLIKREQNTTFYEDLNPLKQVPVFKDKDLIIRDSHAICSYLVNQYGHESPLYPQEAAARAKVDQILCFDLSHFFPRNSAVLSDYFITGSWIPNQKMASQLLESYGLLNTFLKKSQWLSGNNMTLADLCCIATLSSSELLVPVDPEQYPLTAAWAKRCKQDLLYQQCQPGVDRLKEVMASWKVPTSSTLKSRP